MRCENIRAFIDAYADGELDLANSLKVERHTLACPDCLRASRNLSVLRSAMRDEALYLKAPEHLKQRVISAARGRGEASSRSVAPLFASHRRTPAASTTSNVLWMPRAKTWGLLAAAACAALLAVTASLLVQRPKAVSPDDLIAQEVISNHVRSLMDPNHHVDVLSSDRHTVKPWFNGKLDFSPAVENPADEGFPLIGGRLDYLGGRAVAALLYQRRQHYINLFVWPSNSGDELAGKAARRQGYNLFHWDKSGLVFWAVSDLNEAELRQFAETIRNRPPQPN